jgi:hypothetical protein
MRRLMFVERATMFRTGLLVSGLRDDPKADFRSFGSPVEIRLPDGGVYHTTIVSIPLGSPPLQDRAFLVLAPPECEIIPGAELWLPDLNEA